MTIRLDEINQKYAKHLSNILNNDQKLAETLGQKQNNESRDNFLEHVKDWCRKTNSVSFAIVIDKSAIGMISLSHRDFNNFTARAGYWISSDYWNKGYTTMAFQQIVDIARKGKFKKINSYIDKNNIASLSIWKKFGATFKKQDGGLTASIEL